MRGALRNHWIWVVALSAASIFMVIARGHERNRSIQVHVENLSEVMALIQRQSVEPPDSREITHASLDGMLHVLDPHSDYLDESEYRQGWEEQKGYFFGIGCSIRQQSEGIVVANTVRGGPSERAGIRPGDLIREIDGENTEGWTVAQVIQKIHGEKDTVVEVSIQRCGASGLIHYPLIRARISTESVDSAFLITSTAGLIAIRDFSETTPEEFERAVADLRKKGMKCLILDLRGNHGGLLNAALSVSRQLLGPDERVVSQKGRRSRDVDETPASGGAAMDPFPLVVLIDGGTASSAEIVAGAIQDHDRGLVVGTTSWGKGLVQTVFPVGRSCGLRLTTARYFTPSGRCIQRDYRHDPDGYWFPEETSAAPPEGPAYTTDLGRIVYGGGGITPDHFVAQARLTPFVAGLRDRHGAFFRFVLREPSTGAEVLSRFKSFLQEERIPCSESEWTDPANQAGMMSQLAFERLNLRHGQEAGFRYLCERDPQVLKALDALPESEQLLHRKAATSQAAARNLPHTESP